jgi:Leucine-rich repeat (LRR) protein
MPVEIGSLAYLTELYLEMNNMSGVITEEHFAGLMNLKTIDLSFNNLEFTIDSHWVPPFNLDYGYFSPCYLGPQFPKWLRWQKGTIELDISNTGLVGRIPDWFWTTFSEAESLDISSNQLSGDLPLSLEFMSVIDLSMHSNQSAGSVFRRCS